MLARFIILTLAVSSVVEARLPADTLEFTSSDFAHLNFLYDRRCGFAVLGRRNGYKRFLSGLDQLTSGLRSTVGITALNQKAIRREGTRIRNRQIDLVAERVLNEHLARGGKEHLMPVVADALDDHQLDPGTGVLRSNTSAPAALKSDATDERTTFLRFQSLFYLLKTNRIPPFLLNRGYFNLGRNQTLLPGGALNDQDERVPAFGAERGENRIYFRHGTFWGAGITLTELAAHQEELLAAPTLRHLTLYLTSNEVVRALNSPVLDRLTSLTVVVMRYNYFRPTGTAPLRTFRVSPLEQSHYPDLNLLREQGPLRMRQLEHLAFYNEFFDQHTFQTNHLLPLFRGATKLSELDLRGVVIRHSAREPLLKNLNILRLVNSLGGHFSDLVDRPIANRRNWAYLQPFVESLNPNLEEMEWEESDVEPDEHYDPILANLIGDAMQFAPQFLKLRALRLAGLEITAEQWRRLANNSSIWKNLKQFEYSETREPRPEGRQSILDFLHRALRSRRGIEAQINFPPPDED